MGHRGNLRAAAYLIPCQGDKILLLKRFNTGYEDGNYSFIAGHVEHNESPSSAIVREAYEEAHIRIELKDLTFIQVVHRKCPDNLVYVDYFFTISQWQGEPRIAEPDKCSGLNWFSVSNLPPNVIPYIRAVIRKWQGEPVCLNEYGWNDNKELQ